MLYIYGCCVSCVHMQQHADSNQQQPRADATFILIPVDVLPLRRLRRTDNGQCGTEHQVL
jgi:hypothetical protein